DLFGMENSFYPYNPSFDMPNDGGRMAHVLALIEAGHGDQLLLSHDIAYKTSLVKYGGYRYHPPLRNLLPPPPPKGRREARVRPLLLGTTPPRLALRRAPPHTPRRAFAFG